MSFPTSRSVLDSILVNWALKIGFIFCLVLVIHSFCVLTSDFLFFQMAKFKVAKIVNVETSYPSTSGHNWIITVEYLDKSSNDFLKTIRTRTGMGKYAEGDEISVYYDPDNFKDVRIKEWSFLLPIEIFYILAGIATALGILKIHKGRYFF